MKWFRLLGGVALLAGSILQAGAANVAASQAPTVQLSGPLAAKFFASGSGDLRFTAAPGSTVAFSQSFGSLGFNAEGSILGCSNSTGIDEWSRPFTDVIPQADGSCTAVVAQGNGYQAGSGDLNAFNMALTGALMVSGPGQVTLTFWADDGYILGVGQGSGGGKPALVSGAMHNAPSTTPFSELPVITAYDDGLTYSSNDAVVSFPAAGSYPFELDYFETEGAQLALTVTANGGPIGTMAGQTPVLLGSAWYGGHGVNVCYPSGDRSTDYCGGEHFVVADPRDDKGNALGWWQCVELAQRFYLAQGWTSGTGIFSGVLGAADIETWAQNTPGMKWHKDGSGYVPQAGDLIVTDRSPGNFGAGHVSVVDWTDTSSRTIYVVEQNYSRTGRATYTYGSADNLTRTWPADTTPILGTVEVVSSNTKATPSDGGSVHLPGGIELALDPGVSVASATLSVSSLSADQLPEPIPSGLTLEGYGASVALPTLTSGSSATLSFPYDPSLVPAGYQVAIYQDGAWTKLPTTISGTTATAQITASTGYAMLAYQTPPTAPRSVAADVGNTWANVHWNAPASDGGSPITSYKVTSSPVGKTCNTSGALSCVVSGLANGQAYKFSVKAINAIGSGPASSWSAAVTPAAVETMSVVATTAWAAGAVHSVTVTVRDTSNAVDATYRGTVHFTSTDAKVVLPPDYTFTAGDAGVHVFSLAATLKIAGIQAIRARDNSTSSLTGLQYGIVVAPGAAVTLSVSGFPTSDTAGTVQSITVNALDAYGNVATGYTGTVHFTSTDARATMPADYAFAVADKGVRTFSLTLKTVGTQSIRARDTVTATITGLQQKIVVTPGAAVSLSVNGFPSPDTAGTAATLTVKALDAYGNVATGYLGTIHFTSTDAKAVLPADYTFMGADQGVHVFSVTLATAGTQATRARDTVTSTITGIQQGIVVN